ncbi:type II toxin-antitoxin system Phd/YefM family antitoxin [Endothiovibrio diazotrophicus]
MTTANMHDAKTRLSALVRKAEAGEEVTLARGGQPVVKLVPVSPHPPRKPGLWRDALEWQPEGWDEKPSANEVMPELDD